MSSADELVPIPRPDWAELRDLYKVQWPRHEVAYNTVQNYLNWVQIDLRIRHLEVFSLNGTWRENGTYLIVDRYQVLAYTLEESCDSLKRAFMLVDWDYTPMVFSLRKCHRSCLDEVLKLLNIETVVDNNCLLYHIPKEEAIKFNIDLPAGLQLRRLQANDAVYANQIWPHRHAGSEYLLKRLASWNVSVGLFNDSNELLAWCFVWPTGAIGPLEVHPDHYRKGYGTIITKAIAIEQAKMGLNCYGTVVLANERSKAMFTKLGFTIVDNHFFVRSRPTKLCEWHEY